MVPKVGFEPTRVLAQRCLRPPRLPFRHFGPRTRARAREGARPFAHHTPQAARPGQSEGPPERARGRRGWSGRRGSNSRPPPWQGGALPLSYFRPLERSIPSAAFRPIRPPRLSPPAACCSPAQSRLRHTGCANRDPAPGRCAPGTSGGAARTLLRAASASRPLL